MRVSGCSCPSTRRQTSSTLIEQLRLGEIPLGLVQAAKLFMVWSVSGCSGPSTRAANFQRLAKQRLGLRVLPLGQVQAGQIVHRGVTWCCSPNVLPDFQCLGQQRLRLGKQFLARCKKARLFIDGKGVAIVPCRARAANVQHLGKQRLGLTELPLGLVQHSQFVHGRRACPGALPHAPAGRPPAPVRGAAEPWRTVPVDSKSGRSSPGACLQRRLLAEASLDFLRRPVQQLLDRHLPAARGFFSGAASASRPFCRNSVTALAVAASSSACFLDFLAFLGGCLGVFLGLQRLAPSCPPHASFRPLPHANAPSQTESRQPRQRPGSRQSGDQGVAPAPAPQPLAASNRPRPDRLALQEAAEVIGQCCRAAVPLADLLLQALQADRLQVARHFWIEPATAAPARRPSPSTGYPSARPP